MKSLIRVLLIGFALFVIGVLIIESLNLSKPLTFVVGWCLGVISVWLIIENPHNCMRVVCIISCTKWRDLYTGQPTKGPVPMYGEIYEVINDGVTDEVMWYELKEVPDKWSVKCFRPVDDTFGEKVEEMIKKKLLEEVEA